MKNELKTLYKKDPVLANKVAKELGYKIKAADKDMTYAKKLCSIIKQALASTHIDFMNVEEAVKKGEVQPTDLIPKLKKYLSVIKQAKTVSKTFKE